MPRNTFQAICPCIFTAVTRFSTRCTVPRKMEIISFQTIVCACSAAQEILITLVKSAD